ncbi:MAG: hypothetical protein JWP14_23 [Frankiales bacterium]|jgi:hypothetical protein|nr:hypothetical protein [Frankiales bacterium]
MSTTTRTALAALAAPLLLAACSGGAGLAGSSTTAPSDSPSTGTGMSPAANPSPTGSPSPTTATVAAGPAPCPYSAMRMTSRSAGGAAGSVLVDLILTNTSSATCTVTGYPGLSWVAGADGHQVGSAATRTGEPYQTVALAAGGATVSHARFARAANYPANRCSPVPAAGFRVYPPGQTRADFVPYPDTACSSTQVSQLEVRPFGAG